MLFYTNDYFIILQHADNITIQALFSVLEAIVIAVVRSYLTFQFFSRQNYKKAL